MIVPFQVAHFQRATKDAPRSNYVFLCYSFLAKRAHVVFKSPLYIQIGPQDILSVVRLRSGAESNIVLCQQHQHQVAYTGVKLSLFFLQHKKVVKLSVSLPPPLLTNAVTFFDVMGALLPPPTPISMCVVLSALTVIGDHLLIYIPGYFLQLIDSGIDRSLSVSLSLYGAVLLISYLATLYRSKLARLTLQVPI